LHNAHSPFCPPSIDKPKPAFRGKEIGQRVQSSNFISQNPTPLTCTAPKVNPNNISNLFFLLKNPIILCSILGLHIGEKEKNNQKIQNSLLHAKLISLSISLSDHQSL